MPLVGSPIDLLSTLASSTSTSIAQKYAQGVIKKMTVTTPRTVPSVGAGAVGSIGAGVSGEASA